MTLKLKPGDLALIQAILLSLCLAANNVAADPSQNQSNSVFCGARNEVALISTKPIRQMDDEQLYASANHLLNRGMSAQQRALNHYWLHQDAHNTLHGSQALGKLLSFSFGGYRQTNSSPWASKNDNGSLLETLSLLTHWGNYQLGATNDSIALEYHLAF